MKIRTALPAVLMSLGVALAWVPSWAQAAMFTGHYVTHAQLDSLKPGQSLDEIIKILGKPEGVTRWVDGSRSAVYDSSDVFSGNQRVYLDLDDKNNFEKFEIIDR